jgi:nitrogen regulatory protein P-II 1
MARALLYAYAGSKEVRMKRIEAIIRPGKVADVCSALSSAGQFGMTISAVEGRGSQQGWVNQVRGVSYPVTGLTKARVDVVVKDEDADKIISVIRDAALTGEVGDGKIFVHDMANVIRIRTNESGVAAI